MEHFEKKCPYCGEEIKKEAIKCKHCGSFLTNNIANQENFGEYGLNLYRKIKSEYYNKFFHASGSEKIIINLCLITILIISTIYFLYFLGGLILSIVIMSEALLILRIMGKDLSSGWKKTIPAVLLLLPIIGFLIYSKDPYKPLHKTQGVSKISTSGINSTTPSHVPTIISALPGNQLNSISDIQKEEKNININIDEKNHIPVEEKEKNKGTTVIKNEEKNVNINVNVKYNIEVKEKIELDYLERCKLNLENIACALEMYSTDNAGDYPPSLDYLTGKTVYIHAVPDCPLCRKPYIYERGNNPDDFTIKCGGMNAHMDTGKVQAGYFPQCRPGLRIYFKDNEMEYSAGPVNKVIYYPVIIKD